MPDMLVRLYGLPDNSKEISRLRTENISIRRVFPPDKIQLIAFVKGNFGDGWASECDVAFSNKPVSCFIAVKEKNIIGFACYEVTNKCYFGPTGVLEAERGKGVGKALLISALNGLKEMGYAYGIIGGVSGAVLFYEKTVDAISIPKSHPSIYKDMIGFDEDKAKNGSEFYKYW